MSIYQLENVLEVDLQPVSNEVANKELEKEDRDLNEE